MAEMVSIKNTYTKAIKRTDNLGIKDEIIRDYNSAIKCIKNY